MELNEKKVRLQRLSKAASSSGVSHDEREARATDDERETRATDDEREARATDDEHETRATDDERGTRATDDERETRATDDEREARATDDERETRDVPFLPCDDCDDSLKGSELVQWLILAFVLFITGCLKFIKRNLRY